MLRCLVQKIKVQKTFGAFQSSLLGWFCSVGVIAVLISRRKHFTSQPMLIIRWIFNNFQAPSTVSITSPKKATCFYMNFFGL